MSDYTKTLNGDCLLRYADKIAVIDHLDPYSIPKNVFSSEKSSLPDIEIMDIHAYFVLTHSVYTKAQIKNFKALDAFNSFVKAGFVKNVRHVKINQHFIVLADVRHSQKMNEPPTKPWIILRDDGTIESAHCNCMAGLSETCSHVAATAFFIHLKNNETVSCTDKLSVWPVPKTTEKIQFKRIKDIDWGKPKKSFKSLKKKSLKGINVSNFLTKIQADSPEAVILKVVEPFASNYVPKDFKNLPQSLVHIYNPELKKCSLDDLRNVKITFHLSKEEQEAVFEATMSQSHSTVWFEQRAGRITASKFKDACRARWEHTEKTPSLSLIKSVCYPYKTTCKIPALVYGLKNEDNAIMAYFEKVNKEHSNLEVNKSGLVISMRKPFLAATPDAYIICDCCGIGCLEVKCPYSIKELDISLKEFAELDNSYLKKMEMVIF